MRSCVRLVIASAGLLCFALPGIAQDRPPSWAVGDFRGFNRKYNLDVELKITARGKATRVTWKRGTGRQRADSVDGEWRGNELQFFTDRYEVDRTSNGIYTTKISDRNDTTDLRRVGGGGGWGGNNNPNPTRPPSWAVGTFRGRNDKYNLDVELRINSRGNVDRYIWNNNKPDSESGVWTGDDQIAFGRDRYYVQSSRNGIQTEKLGDSADRTSLRRTSGGSGGSWQPDRPGNTPGQVDSLKHSTGGFGKYVVDRYGPVDIKSVNVDLRGNGIGTIGINLDGDGFTLDGRWRLEGPNRIRFDVERTFDSQRVQGGGTIRLRNTREIESFELDYRTPNGQRTFEVSFRAANG